MIKRISLMCFMIFISLACENSTGENKCTNILKITSYVNDLNNSKAIFLEYEENKIELKKVNKSIFEACIDGIKDKEELTNDLLLDGMFKIQYGEERESFSFILSKNDSSDLIIYNPNKIPSSDFDIEKHKKHMKEFDSLTQMIRQKSN